MFVRNPKFSIKNNLWVTEQYKEIDDFCCRIRDGIVDLIESKNILNKQNVSQQNFQQWQRKKYVMKECTRQSYDITINRRSGNITCQYSI